MINFYPSVKNLLNSHISSIPTVVLTPFLEIGISDHYYHNGFLVTYYSNKIIESIQKIIPNITSYENEPTICKGYKPF